jgi:predicted restriction endonuclease
VAFDQGFISFSDEGTILISEVLNGAEKELFISPEMSLKKFEAEHCKYLQWHRQNIFKAQSCKLE